MKNGLISFIIPCFNESCNVELIYKSLNREFADLDYDYELLFINDGSTDDTLDRTKRLVLTNARVKYVSFTRNFGKEVALLAGFQHAAGEAVIVMDADLQHPCSMIKPLISGYEEGYHQVIAQRNRKGDSRVRSFLSSMYYCVVNKVVEVDLRDGAGDFRLLSRKAVDSLLLLNEGNRFSKGLFSWIGLNQKTIYYDNVARQNGTSKWSFSKLLNYGIDGVISFNNRPLRMCFHAGAFILLLSLIYIFIKLILILNYGITEPGYFTTISAVLFLGGVQLLSLGVIGNTSGEFITNRRSARITSSRKPILKAGMIMRVLSPAFFRFILVGIINTLNYYCVYLLLHEAAGIHYMTAHITGFLMSMVISFFLNAYFTFKVKPTLRRFLQFPLSQLFNISVSSLFVYVFVEFFYLDSTIAPVLSVFITVPLTFLITGKILTK